MNVDEIRQLVKIVEDSDIADLEVTRWGRKVKITKYPSGSSSNSNHMGAPIYMREPIYQQPNLVPPPPAAPALPAKEAMPPVVEKQNYVEIKSPMVGTFYRSPAPDAEPYVSEGSTVAKGQVLCIIEAMKLMNEIEADFACKIVEVLVQNAQPVEYNQPLFRAVKT